MKSCEPPFLMSGNKPGTAQQPAASADELSRLLELELIQKRAEWQKVTARRHGLRSVAIVFLFLILLGALGAFYMLFTRASEARPQHSARRTAAPVEP